MTGLLDIAIVLVVIVFGVPASILVGSLLTDRLNR